MVGGERSQPSSINGDAIEYKNVKTCITLYTLQFLNAVISY